MKRIGKVILIVFIVIIAAGLYLFAADALYVDNTGIHFEMENITAKVYVKATDTEPSERNILYDLCPVGSVLAYMGTRAEIPEGWLLCDGSLIPSGDDYDDLRNLLRARYNSSGEYRLPDLRGLFLRGTIHAEDVDTGYIREEHKEAYEQNRGSYNSSEINLHGRQTDAFREHTHDYYVRRDGPDDQMETVTYFDSFGVGNEWYIEETPHMYLSIGDTGDLETRPINHGVEYIIKY